jgi:uncharacterized membrane protein
MHIEEPPLIEAQNRTEKPGVIGLSAGTRDNMTAVAHFSEEEAAAISGWQRAIERLSEYCGSATYFAVVIAFIVLWISANSWALRQGRFFLDAAPFPWLQGLVSANALLLTIAVLIRQNRMVRLADHHAHLDLQINLLTEQKVSKVLQMIDELRRDMPAVSDPSDAEVGALIAPADTGAIMQAVKDHLRSTPT